MPRRTMTRAILAALAVAALPAIGQTPPQGEPEIGPDDWQVRCEAGGCLVLKPVPLDGAGEQSRLMLTFAVPRDGGRVRMAVITPLGTALEQGLRLQVGAQESRYQFATCLADGCVVVVELTADDIANMGVQPGITATFAAVNRAEPFAVAIPMADFEQAIEVARNGGQQ